MTGKSKDKSKREKKVKLPVPISQLDPSKKKKNDVKSQRTKKNIKSPSAKLLLEPKKEEKLDLNSPKKNEAAFSKVGLQVDSSKEDSDFKSRMNMPTLDEIKSNETVSFQKETVLPDPQEDDDIELNIKTHISRARRKRSCKPKWDSRELKDLAVALQTYGFNNMKKVTEAVKTKSEESIRNFINKQVRNANSGPPDRKRGRPKNPWTTIDVTDLIGWPVVRKWRKIAYNQVAPHVRTNSYCRPVMESLYARFYEEEDEPDNAEVINVKLIYKYLLDCIAGEIPPQLPPKESALVLELKNELNMLPQIHDFKEEFQFLKDFKSATKFKPIQMKDEFRKVKDESKEEEVPQQGETIIPIPEDLYFDLSRHKKAVQSMNPLGIPLWLLSKEQEFINTQVNHPSSSSS